MRKLSVAICISLKIVYLFLQKHKIILAVHVDYRGLLKILCCIKTTVYIDAVFLPDDVIKVCIIHLVSITKKVCTLRAQK